MSGNIHRLNGSIDPNTLPASQVLDRAKDVFDEVVVAGYDENGRFVMASNTATLPDSLWILELAKAELMKASEDG